MGVVSTTESERRSGPWARAAAEVIAEGKDESRFERLRLLTHDNALCYNAERSKGRHPLNGPWCIRPRAEVLNKVQSRRWCVRGRARRSATAAEAEPSERRSRIEPWKKPLISNRKATYESASRAITWRILCRVFLWALSGASSKTLIAGCATPLFSAINRAKSSGTFQGERSDRECAVLLFRAGGQRKQGARKGEQKREEVMATIRSMVAEKQQQGGHSTDAEIVKEKIRRDLAEVCNLLPNETPVGLEFASVMAELPELREFKDAIDALVAKAMNERDDLQDYPHLREKLVDKINGITC